MAILYPTYETILKLKVPPTEGELVMIDFLRNNLNNEYEIFFQPFLNGDCPDIAVMKKGSGLIIIEVKDWKLDSYNISNDNRWFLVHNNAFIRSPITQVLRYKDNIYKLHIQDLLELKVKNSKYWSIVSCALFFSKENQSDIQDFLCKPYCNKKDILEKYKNTLNKSVELIGKDNLNPIWIEKMLARRWLNKQSYYFTDDLYNSFKRLLKPSFHSLEDGKNINYSKKQLELTISKPGEQKIKGVVGSGKTFVLAKRAVSAHKRTRAKVLILTYNISLRNYIHDKINDVREDFYWDNFVILNYHEFMNSTINNLGIEFRVPEGFDSWSESEVESYWEKNYYGNLELFNDYQGDIQKYSTILVDEVQDYKNNWLRIIKRYFLYINGEFVVFGDSKQDIYNRVSYINKKKDIVIPDSPGRWAELNKSFRFTPAITNFVIAYQSAFFKDSHNLDDFEQEVDTLVFEGGIYYKRLNDINYEEIAKFISSFSEKLGVHRNDICVVTLSIDMIREIDFHYRKITEEKTYLMAETKELYEQNATNSKDIRRNKKLHFWMNSGLTKFSTVHSFKGWEINTLYLVVQKALFKETHNEILYTGFTRCMENLVIINIDDEEIYSFINTLSYVEQV